MVSDWIKSVIAVGLLAHIGIFSIADFTERYYASRKDNTAMIEITMDEYCRMLMQKDCRLPDDIPANSYHFKPSSVTVSGLQTSATTTTTTLENQLR